MSYYPMSYIIFDTFIRCLCIQPRKSKNFFFVSQERRGRAKR